MQTTDHPEQPPERHRITPARGKGRVLTTVQHAGVRYRVLAYLGRPELTVLRVPAAGSGDGVSWLDLPAAVLRVLGGAIGQVEAGP